MNFKLIKHLTRLSILSLLLVTTACKKKEIQGPKGEPGVNGTGGNASMSSSAEFVVAATEWTNENNVWKYVYSSALISAKVVNTGGLKVYMKVGTSWNELPFADGDVLTQFGFSEGKVNISVADIHGGLPAQPGTTTFRLITFYDSPRSDNTETKLVSQSNHNQLQ